MKEHHHDLEMSRSMSRSRSESAPDGGYGWVIVLAAFMLQGISAGLALSVGIYYTEWRDVFDADPATTAWVGSINTGLLFIAGPAASVLSARWGHRTVCMLGTVMTSLGLLLSSFSLSIHMLYFTYSLLAGIGYCFMYIPCTVIVGEYFTTRRAFAMPLSAAGVGVVCLAAPPFLRALIKHYSWRGSLMVSAGVTLQGAVFAALLRPLKRGRGHKTRSQYAKDGSKYDETGSKDDETGSNCFETGTKYNQTGSQCIITGPKYAELGLDSEKAGPADRTSVPDADETISLHRDTKTKLNDMETSEMTLSVHTKTSSNYPGLINIALFKSVLFWTFFINQVLWNFSSFILLVLVMDYAKETGGIPKDMGALLLTMAGVASLIGRLTVALVARHVNRLLIYTCATLLLGVVIAFIPVAVRIAFSALVTCCTAYGACLGTQVALLGILTVDLFSVEHLNSAYGLLLVSNGVGALLGPPIAGQLYNVANSYEIPFYFGGAVSILAGVLMIPVHCIRSPRTTTVIVTTTGDEDPEIEQCVMVYTDQSKNNEEGNVAL